MKTTNKSILFIAVLTSVLQGCTHADDYVAPTPEVLTSSPNELLVERFTTAPVVDGNIDAIWDSARPLLNSYTVPSAGIRTVPLNSDGFLNTEPLDIFDPYKGETNKFSLRGGHDGTNLYLLLEVEDGNDSQDRESFYFYAPTQTWKQEHKYANNANDKFYEDKFGFMFPIKDASGVIPAGWNEGTCSFTCHKGLTGAVAGDKDTRHYMPVAGTKADLWHWKRVRNAISGSVDDGYVSAFNDAAGLVDKRGTAQAQGRLPDAGKNPYDDKPVFTDPITGKKGPKWIKPGVENYYWVTKDELANFTAKTVVNVAVDGTLSYINDAAGTILTLNPNTDLASYAQGTGKKRFPSVTINDGSGYVGYDSRNDTKIKATHTGTKWVLEITRKLITEDVANDAAFEIGKEMKFGMSFFSNAAIAHGTLNLLTMKIVE
ncbi:ethylbenzene dehydrogenase-related protein [Flavobacterium sp.]|uniref:ethylbenzene dehydrogenase-related protein n=1 Tax=Flavobacterium sp. TaxID=239 RepID=UPI002B4B7790|nr:ethylbenzene dehydrogenase-related protein [Flavobacterium sp.]HLF51323.1 ethylbenzene dehydrogenase-related protein [Flavobacterium sp.]